MKTKITTIVILSILMFFAAAWAGLTKTEISGLYVGIFGRASEGEGNRYWQTLGLGMSTTADVMLETDAAKNYFGDSLNTNQAFIEHIYDNTLNKTYAEDSEGINYWVGMLDAGASRGFVVATLVSAVRNYAPDGPSYDPLDLAATSAYTRFTNRVEVSDYMADRVEKTPDNWAVTTSFSSIGLNVTEGPATVDTAKIIIDGFAGEGQEEIFTETITAEKGMVIEAPGFRLEILPGALLEDTEISAFSIPAQEFTGEQRLGGIRFSPDGLELEKMAVVEVPIELPADWSEDELIPIYEFAGDDPSFAAWNGHFAEVKMVDGQAVAVAPVFHFSGNLFIRNCHSGTFKYVLDQFQSRGCDPAKAIERVREQFSELGNITAKTEKIFDKDIQRFLGTFFEEKYVFNRGSDVSQTIVTEMAQNIDQNRLVVLAFNSETWPAKGTDSLYPKFMHTAVLEKKDGKVQIRNSANITDDKKDEAVSKTKKLIDAMGGTNLIYYDWDKVNEFRELQTGVGVELACGLQPGQLGAVDLNPLNLKVYPPLNGKNWGDFAWEDPFAFGAAVAFGNWQSVSGIPPRTRPWTAVKIYVQKESLFSNPCETIVGSWNFSGSRRDGVQRTGTMDFRKDGSFDWTIKDADGQSDGSGTGSWSLSDGTLTLNFYNWWSGPVVGSENSFIFSTSHGTYAFTRTDSF